MNVHGQQQYTFVGKLPAFYVGEWAGVQVMSGPMDVHMCQGCGDLVGDKALHDEMHRKTRSVV
jgi:hypothetical protein